MVRCDNHRCRDPAARCGFPFQFLEIKVGHRDASVDEASNSLEYWKPTTNGDAAMRASDAGTAQSSRLLARWGNGRTVHVCLLIVQNRLSNLLLRLLGDEVRSGSPALSLEASKWPLRVHRQM